MCVQEPDHDCLLVLLHAGDGQEAPHRVADNMRLPPAAVRDVASTLCTSAFCTRCRAHGGLHPCCSQKLEYRLRWRGSLPSHLQHRERPAMAKDTHVAVMARPQCLLGKRASEAWKACFTPQARTLG